MIDWNTTKEYREGYPGMFFCADAALKARIEKLAKEQKISPERYLYRIVKNAVAVDSLASEIRGGKKQ
jgi:hypothetical protein